MNVTDPKKPRAFFSYLEAIAVFGNGEAFWGSSVNLSPEEGRKRCRRPRAENEVEESQRIAVVPVDGPFGDLQTLQKCFLTAKLLPAGTTVAYDLGGKTWRGKLHGHLKIPTCHKLKNGCLELPDDCQMVIADAQLVWLDRLCLKGNCAQGTVRVSNGRVRMTGCDVFGGKGAALLVEGCEAGCSAPSPGSPSQCPTTLGAFNCKFHSEVNSGVQVEGPCEVALLGGCTSDRNGGEGWSVRGEGAKFAAEDSSASFNKAGNVSVHLGSVRLLRCELNNSMECGLKAYGGETQASYCCINGNTSHNVLVHGGLCSLYTCCEASKSKKGAGWCVQGPGSKLVASNSIACKNALSPRAVDHAVLEVTDCTVR